MDQYIGRLLDNRYEILEVIGTGGMAVVYKALCHRLNRMVAIKILKDEFFQDEEFRRRFHAEGQAVAMLSHPNIVSVYDVSTSGDADYIVMELVEGITLKQYMEKKGYLNWRETLHFSMQIAKALEHAHSKGIIHRDIKPHNVMILKNGTAKVTDFGIARIVSSTNTLTKEALGSVHYISPEQAKGGRVDNRSDIYSLGVVMYEMMTGRPPYDGDSPVAIALKHINGGAIMPSVLNPNLPGGLEQIIMKAMALEPENRYSSATEMLYELEEFRKNPEILFYHDHDILPVQPKRPSSQEPPVRRAPPRNTAERVAGTRQPSRPPYQGQDPRRQSQNRPQNPNRPQSQNRSQRPPMPEPEEEPKKSRTTTIAIVAVSAVALLLVLIFGISALVRSMGGSNDVTVNVPNFVGMYWEDLDGNREEYPDFVFVDKSYEYSDEYKKGQIMEQSPKDRTQVSSGSKVEFVISMGVQTEDMPDLVNMTPDNAKKILNQYKLKLTIRQETEPSDKIDEGKITRTEPAADAELSDGMTVVFYVSEGKDSDTMPDLTEKSPAEAMNILTGYKLDLKFTQKTENDEEVPEGKIIRTEPAKDAKITKGATVTLWVSSGPEQVRVPQVVGMDILKALEILNNNGLKGEYNRVASDKDKDQVVKQSVDKGEMVDKGTVIQLEISEGPTEPPTEATEPLKTKTVTLRNLPTKESDYLLSIRKDGTKVLDDMMVEPGTTEIPVVLEGRGSVYYDLYVDDTYFDTIRVDFG